ncbi:MAG: acyl-CoA thioesterase [Candidatus Thermoplasmatota archaeon]|jgi:acyl-CoA hydrolase|nr:acyl-CoA thioesterase [Candidatus Thermoplasmatota archaeon]MCL5800085.1 acyl-CoA thioesterase [Candidatus Thermoplasmatota archaeon]
MDPKSWKESFAMVQRVVLPPDTNVFGNLYGGRLMEWIDNVASISAFKHSRSKVVTGSIDSLYFLTPIKMGDIVTIESKIDYVTRETMEVETTVFTEDHNTAVKRFATRAFLTYVAVDDLGKPVQVPDLKIETEEDRTRWDEGARRSEHRKKQLKEIKQFPPKF